MRVVGLCLGPLATNCYLAWEEGAAEALLVDAAGEAADITGAAHRHGVRITLIVATHGHRDHTECLAQLKERTGAPLAVHRLDAPMLSDPTLSGAALFGFPQDNVAADQMLSEGDLISVGEGGPELTVLHTPGHTPGSICLLGEGALFSGDCLFAGGIGRMDLPGGDERAMMESLARLASLDPALTVYPGHGPTTTIGRELRTNPWLTSPSP